MKDHNDTEDDPEWPSKKEGCKKTKTSSVILNGRRKNVYPATAVYLEAWCLGNRVLLAPLAPTTYVVRSIHSDREKHSKREDEQLWQPNSRHDALRVEHAILSRDFLMLSNARSPANQESF